MSPIHQRLMLLVGALPEEMHAHGHSVAELIEAELTEKKAALEIRCPHVWDVDGRARGVMHRLTLRGETLVVEDVGLDEHGEPLDVGVDRTEIPFVDAVHILLNLTPEERARLGVERTQRPADPTSPLAEQVLTMVHAFPDSGRKDAVRSLAAQVAAMEADHARLARERAEIDEAASATIAQYRADRDAAVHARTGERMMMGSRAAEAETDRDHLAAALAEVREAWAAVDVGELAAGIYASSGSGPDGRERLRLAGFAIDRMNAATLATTADLGATLDARIAESVRERCARLVDWHADHDPLADAMRSMPLDEADRIERGGR